MFLTVAANGLLAVIGVTIRAAVTTGVVRANIDAFHAAAFQPLIFVLCNEHGAMRQPLEKPVVDTSRAFDSVPL